MSVRFQINLNTNEDITTPKTVISGWTLFALYGVVFLNCDAANILKKARVSHYTELSHRHKMKLLCSYHNSKTS